MKKRQTCVWLFFFGDGGTQVVAWVLPAIPLLPIFNTDNWWVWLKKPKLELG
jgi:hypothetical protein